ncbi:MAG: acylphosphatase [Nanoarchaeota archaeon]|nr:acylphosphatase [Nanoarchaeota archaeon]
MKKAMKIFIFGTVQGVFFRKYIKDSADKVGVKGFVRNKEDGSIEIVVEGNSKEVNDMVELCKQGPPHSQIRRVDFLDEKFQGLSGFKILRF